MIAKKFLFVAIVVAMLASIIAFPVVAGDQDIAMWSHRVRLAYNGRSSTSPDRVVGMIHVRDANKAMVKGAVVTATWTLPDGRVLRTTATTAFQGIATFKTWAGRGVYKICVTNVTKAGWLYDPNLNRQTCASQTVR